uniref:CCDC22 N-terminal domain-containing protein n=1 Tax=Clastoptera arizonana TaxID=38151 RepID=A0A1B6C265_9HEMI
MEEVDKIILHSLKEIGCDIDIEVKNLHQLTSDLIVEAVVRCLTTIQPGLEISYHIPPSMSGKFKIGGALAEACTELGYTGEIGYQTFLYPNEGDIRKVFIFLIEKLPRDSDKSIIQTEDSAPTLRQSISHKLKEDLSTPWSPPSASILKKSSFISVPLESGISLPGQKRDCTPQEWREYCVHQLPFFHNQPPSTSMLLPSIISFNAKTCMHLNQASPSIEENNDQCLGIKPLPLIERKTWLTTTSKLLYTKDVFF